MDIQISQLLAVADRILNHVVLCLGKDVITIPDAYLAYWDVSNDAGLRYKYPAPLPDASLGNLDSDWQVIRKFPVSPAGRLTDLVELSNLLRAIGDNPAWVLGQPAVPPTKKVP